MSTLESSVDEPKSDIAKAVLSGALRFALPALCFILLYAFILRRWGAEVFGLWSLFAAAQTFVSLADIGLSQSLARESGPDVPPNKQLDVARDRAASLRFYGLLTAVVAAFSAVLFAVASPAADLYSSAGIWLAALLTVIGGGLKLIARLDLALASAFGAAAASVRLQGYGQAVLLAVAFVTCLTFPIEGFALGFLLSGAFELILARRLAVISGFVMRSPAMTNRRALGRVRTVISRGRFMYLTGIGSAIREPLFRFVIAGFFGVATAGYVDVALRSSKAAREVGVFGLSATFPYFARHFRQGDRQGSIDLIHWTLSLSLILGSLPMGALLIFSRPIFTIWLGEVGEGVIVTTAALTFWSWMTLANLPFWYAALASDLDRKVAGSVWLHALSVLALVVLVPLGLDYNGTLLVWLAGAAVTQVAIILPIATQFGWRAIFTVRICIQLCLSLAYLVASAGAAFTGFGATNDVTAISLVGIAMALALSLLIIGRTELLQLLRLMVPKARIRQFQATAEG